MVVEGMQALSLGLDSIIHWNTALVGLNGHFQVDWIVLAQDASDANVLSQMSSAWNNFVKTGQIWALLIGLVLGYLFRGFTSF
jgi:hypothetical protein